MKFFLPNLPELPAVSTPEEAEKRLERIVKWVKRKVPPHDERIYRMEYKHNGKPYVAEVGQSIDPYYKSPGPVIAIFGGNPLLICMRDRGVVRGEPIYVATQAVQHVEYFDT